MPSNRFRVGDQWPVNWLITSLNDIKYLLIASATFSENSYRHVPFVHLKLDQRALQYFLFEAPQTTSRVQIGCLTLSGISGEMSVEYLNAFASRLKETFVSPFADGIHVSLIDCEFATLRALCEFISRLPNLNILEVKTVRCGREQPPTIPSRRLSLPILAIDISSSLAGTDVALAKKLISIADNMNTLQLNIRGQFSSVELKLLGELVSHERLRYLDIGIHPDPNTKLSGDERLLHGWKIFLQTLEIISATRSDATRPNGEGIVMFHLPSFESILELQRHAPSDILDSRFPEGWETIVENANCGSSDGPREWYIPAGLEGYPQ